MSWKAYSWKAITCCVSKGVLTLLGVLCFLGALIGVSVFMAHATRDVGTAPDWVRELFPIALIALMATGGFVSAAALVASICSSQISYCQAAVDTGRKPWYWIPWSRIADPLPPREWIETTCEHCEHTSAREETEAEYRERLGLAPLEHAAREEG